MSHSKYYFVAFICCISNFLAIGQDYLNKINKIEGNNAIFTESEWYNDTLFVASTIFTSQGRTGAILEFEKNGELAVVAPLIDSFTNFGTGFWDKGFKEYNDTLYHIAMKGFDTKSSTGLLLKMDLNGKVINEA